MGRAASGAAKVEAALVVDGRRRLKEGNVTGIPEAGHDPELASRSRATSGAPGGLGVPVAASEDRGHQPMVPDPSVTTLTGSAAGTLDGDHS